MREMTGALPEPSWDEMDHWLNCQTTVPGWYTHAQAFASEQLRTQRAGFGPLSSLCSYPQHQTPAKLNFNVLRRNRYG